MNAPNIVLLYTDQQRFDALSANGNPEVITPNLDRLAAESINFTHCFVQHPLCMPSRASFMSGRYPSALGLTHMGVPLPQDLPVLPSLLRQAGYYTSNIGKLHFLPHSNRDHRIPHPSYGFDWLEVSDEPGCYEDAYRAWVRRLDPSQLPFLSLGRPPNAVTWQASVGLEDGIDHEERDDFTRPRAFRGKPEFTHSAFVARRTIDFLEQQGTARQPFCCVAGFYSPHSPMVAPQSFFDLYDPKALSLPDYPENTTAQNENGRAASVTDEDQLRAVRHGYYAMVSEVDFWVGEIMSTLKKQGLDQNTIVVFTSDHGEWLGDNRRWAKDYPAPDCVSRVPLLIRWPAGMKQPSRVDGLVEAVDVLPTLLEAAGMPIPPDLQGQSLMPCLRGDPWSGKEAALMEGSAGKCVDAAWRSLRTKTHHYIMHADGRECLWDLQSDPGEYHDIGDCPESATVLAECRHMLLKRILENERPLPRTAPY